MFRFYDLEENPCGKRDVNEGDSTCGALNATSGEPLLDLNVAGSATKLYGGGNMICPIGVTRDPNGNIYVACHNAHNVL